MKRSTATCAHSCASIPPSYPPPTEARLSLSSILRPAMNSFDVACRQVLDNKVIVLMDPAKVNQEIDPLRVNRTREKRSVRNGNEV